MDKVIFVGVKRDYHKIQTAINNAKNNSIIVVDPGVYKENVIVNKLVNLRANTNNPENGDIVIDGGKDIPVVFDYTPDEEEVVYFEGFQLVRREGSCQKACLISNSNFNLSIVFNKNRILANASQYALSISRGVCINKVTIKHCFLQRGEAHIGRFDYKNTNHLSIIKTELDTSTLFKFCKGKPDKLDIVESPKEGYGPKYGEYYMEIPSYTVRSSILSKIKNFLSSKI